MTLSLNVPFGRTQSPSEVVSTTQVLEIVIESWAAGLNICYWGNSSKAQHAHQTANSKAQTEVNPPYSVWPEESISTSSLLFHRSSCRQQYDPPQTVVQAKQALSYQPLVTGKCLSPQPSLRMFHLTDFIRPMSFMLWAAQAKHSRVAHVPKRKDCFPQFVDHTFTNTAQPQAIFSSPLIFPCHQVDHSFHLIWYYP